MMAAPTEERARIFNSNWIGSHEPLEVFRAKDNSQKWGDAWISPEGQWYNAEFGSHESFANHALNELYPLENPNDFKAFSHRLENAGIILRKLGWIQVQTTGEKYWGIQIIGYAKMTKAQYKTLLEHFGNKKLFRGWTIESLYQSTLEQIKTTEDKKSD